MIECFSKGTHNGIKSDHCIAQGCKPTGYATSHLKRRNILYRQGSNALAIFGHSQAQDSFYSTPGSMGRGS